MRLVCGPESTSHFNHEMLEERFMSIVVLEKKKHAGLTYKALNDYSFTSDMITMPLLTMEVKEAARCFPIIFPQPNSALPHALLGLGRKNIFVDEEGQWKAAYLPLHASNYPFSLVQAHFAGEPGKRELALGIEEDAPHFHQPDGDPLYTPDGEATELLQHILTAIGNQYKRHRASEQTLAQLALTNALGESVVAVRHQGAERTVGGLRVARREKIMALPEATLGKWVKNGLMDMLFAHWESLQHLQKLLDDPSCPDPNVPQPETLQ